MVMFWHLPWASLPFPWRPATWAGVDLFFVLSGYLIGTQLLRPYARGDRPSYLDFFLRRTFRVLPAYLVVLLAYFSIPQFREEPGISPIWRFLTFTQNFGLDASIVGAFSHAWSLCVEEHFYLVLPNRFNRCFRAQLTRRLVDSLRRAAARTLCPWLE